MSDAKFVALSKESKASTNGSVLIQNSNVLLDSLSRARICWFTKDEYYEKVRD